MGCPGQEKGLLEIGGVPGVGEGVSRARGCGMGRRGAEGLREGAVRRGGGLAPGVQERSGGGLPRRIGPARSGAWEPPERGRDARRPGSVSP